MDICPVCNSKDTGKIGCGQYYCSNCCVEYDSGQNVFGIEEDGSLIQLEM